MNRVDSVMLLEEGFEVQSADISDKMLKQAYETRWDRRKEDIFDRWGKKFFMTLNLIWKITILHELIMLRIINQLPYFKPDSDQRSELVDIGG